MRNDSLKCIVFLWIFSISAFTALPYSEDSASNRNNLPDILTSKPKSSFTTVSSNSIHECLYLRPNLPVCDFERMESTEEDISTKDYRETNENVRKDRHSFRVRRSFDVTEFGIEKTFPRKQVIVYTIEGCIPPRLPFTMPSCRETNSRGKIVEVRKLYPFTVNGLTKPPLVFPEFNFDRWVRMMKRLENRTSSTGNTETNREVPVPSELSSPTKVFHRRSNVPMKVATANAITPNAIDAKINVSKGSSPNRFILRSSNERTERTLDTKEREIKDSTSKSLASEKIDFNGEEIHAVDVMPLRIKNTREQEHHLVRSSISKSTKDETTQTKIYGTKDTTEKRRRKIEPTKKLFYGREKSKSIPRSDERRNVFTNDRQSDVSSLWQEEHGTRTIPEIPRTDASTLPPPPLSWKPQTSSMETNQNLYRRPIISDDTSNDLRVTDNSSKFSNLLTAILNVFARDRKIPDGENVAWNVKTNSREINSEGITDYLDDPSTVLRENTRKRRDTRRTRTHPERRTWYAPSTRGISVKSIVKRSRDLRETVNSRGNGLDIHDKRDKFLHSDGNHFLPGKHGLAVKHEVGGTTGNKVLKVTQRDTTENLTFHSKADISYTTNLFHDKIDVSATLGPISRGSFIDKIAGRKKYGKYSKMTSKKGERSRNQKEE